MARRSTASLQIAASLACRIARLLLASCIQLLQPSAPAPATEDSGVGRRALASCAAALHLLRFAEAAMDDAFPPALPNTAVGPSATALGSQIDRQALASQRRALLAPSPTPARSLSPRPCAQTRGGAALCD
jgi:hypothetical protein